jgi:predicted phosphodiesterase
VEANVRLQVFSDLHVDVRQPKAIQVVSDADAVVVAGDVCDAKLRGVADALRRQAMPTVLPLGQRDDADHIEAWGAEKERQLLDFFLLTLGEDRAETARPPACFSAPRRPQPRGRP